MSSLASASAAFGASSAQSGQIADMTASIGEGMAQGLDIGESVTVSGENLVVTVEVIDENADGETEVAGGDVTVPSGIGWGRRLQEIAEDTKNVAVIVTDWINTNIFYHANQKYDVQKDANLKNVIVLKGTQVAKLTDPVKIVMHLQTPADDAHPLCLWWNKDADEWSRFGMTTAPVVFNGANASVTCSSMHSTGTYAVIFMETDTTVTTASSTSRKPYDRPDGNGGGGPIGSSEAVDRDSAGIETGMVILIIFLVLLCVVITVVAAGVGTRIMMRGGDDMKQPMADDFGDIDERLDGTASHLPSGIINVSLPAGADAENPVQVDFEEREEDEPQVAIQIDRPRGVRMPEAQHSQAFSEEHDEFDSAHHFRCEDDMDESPPAGSSRPPRPLNFCGHDGDLDDIEEESEGEWH